MTHPKASGWSPSLFRLATSSNHGYGALGRVSDEARDECATYLFLLQ